MKATAMLLVPASLKVTHPRIWLSQSLPLALVLLLIAWSASAEQYRGNGDTGSGGAIGNGTLTLSDDGTNISGTLTVGGSMNDVLVLYIQSGTGGFTDTSGFNDQSDACPQAISGVSAAGRSVLTFASGFQPNYAIALAPAAAGTGGLWQLANGGNNSMVYMGSINLSPLNNTGPYFTFSFPAALIGMIPGVRSAIQVFGTYLKTDGSRSTEAVAGDLAGALGWNPFTQNAWATYTFDAGALLIKLPLGIWAQRASSGSLDGRQFSTAVWTGSEMIVWGGLGNSGYLNTGGRYNPAANSWTALPTNGAPVPCFSHTAVWTGSEMIIWGGWGLGGAENDGARYNPVINAWTALPLTGAPTGRYNHTAVWTGSEMIVWGGFNSTTDFNNGARFNPTANSWTALPTSGAPSRRSGHTAVWTGSEMIVWGGLGDFYFNNGGRYNPVTNGWTTLSVTNAPSVRRFHTAVWTGSEMIVWGGSGLSSSGYLNDGGRYNPVTMSWTPLPATGAPAARAGHMTVWTGGEMIVWGGPFNDGGRFNPTVSTWTALPTNGAPNAVGNPTGVWTGTQMIVWGGYGTGSYLSDTWSYSPYAPAVRISRWSTSTAIAWPVWFPTLRLCQTTNLAAGNWTTVTNTLTQIGSENHVTISPLNGRQFFRVEYP